MVWSDARQIFNRIQSQMFSSYVVSRTLRLSFIPLFLLRCLYFWNLVPDGASSNQDGCCCKRANCIQKAVQKTGFLANLAVFVLYTDLLPHCSVSQGHTNTGSRTTLCTHNMRITHHIQNMQCKLLKDR